MMVLLIFVVQPPETNGKVSRTTAEAFAELYEQFLPKVFNFISYRIADKNIAEDLTSAVFEKALTKFKSYSSEKAAFSTWIFSIARNTVIDHYRVSKEQAVYSDDVLFASDGDASPEEEAILAEEVKKLHSCVAQLSRHEQEIVSLKFGAEMNNRQIARELGLSESNVGIIVYRAVRKLRDNFKGWQNGQRK